MTTPKYRDDIKGHVKEVIADFMAQYRGEHTNSLCFTFGTNEEIRESESYREYADTLTDTEMLRAAQKVN